jgi:hypothetical protein
MTITSVDGIGNALLNSVPSLLGVNKASIANTVAGQWFALWRATGNPAQGNIPGAVAVCDNTTLGGMPFTNPISPALSYLGGAGLISGNNGTPIIVSDRLSHMGGLNGTLTSAQIVSVDCTVATSNMVARKGASNYSDIEWWLEWYTDTGATVVNATVAVVYDDASTANIVIALTATMRASRRLPILSTTGGRFIRSITSVTLSATTGTVGSFGVTATRALSIIGTGTAGMLTPHDWALIRAQRVLDSACLEKSVLCPTTTTGALYGHVNLIQG